MVELSIRKPVVAGQFYPGTEKALKEQIASLANWQKQKKEVIACILPHAGYIYSGKVAAEVVSGIVVKENILLLGPNHTGNGAVFSIMPKGLWQTPLGQIKINENLAKAILKNSVYLQADFLAHLAEHSIEVELPILQYARADFSIVPLAIGPAEPDIYKQIGKELASAIKEANLQDSLLIVASSDMTHYEPQKIAEEKDDLAIKAILEMDEDKLWKNLRKYDITTCGYGPVIILLSLVKGLGAQKAELIKYQTSAEVSADYSSVVGYAGIVIY